MPKTACNNKVISISFTTDIHFEAVGFLWSPTASFVLYLSRSNISFMVDALNKFCFFVRILSFVFFFMDFCETRNWNLAKL